jgi:large subunit ribosomal protein L23
MDKVIIKPIISEKSLKDAKAGWYTFLVSKDASKEDIKRAVERLFDVQVKGVLTNIIKGKDVKFNRRGRRIEKIYYKKARVKLGKDQKIDIFEEFIKEEKK